MESEFDHKTFIFAVKYHEGCWKTTMVWTVNKFAYGRQHGTDQRRPSLSGLNRILQTPKTNWNHIFEVSQISIPELSHYNTFHIIIQKSKNDTSRYCVSSPKHLACGSLFTCMQNRKESSIPINPFLLNAILH